MQPHYLKVVRTARYFTHGSDPGQTSHLWIALHGHAMLAERFLKRLVPLGELRGTLVAAPEALSRFYLQTGLDGRHGETIGATWLTREDRESDLADTRSYLDRLHAELTGSLAAGTRLGILGFSQGAVMAARWVAGGTVVPDHVVLWGIEPPGDALAALAERLQGRELTLVAGDRDALAPAGGIEGHAHRLAQAGVRARAERFRGGHVVERGTLLRVAGGLAER
jgi:dienelactone hydrolase